jgi:hypothetical protein
MKNPITIHKTRITRFAGALLCAVSLAFFATSAFGDLTRDRPEDVMKAGKNASEGLAQVAAVVREAQAISAHMERDRAYATRVLELAKRNDRSTLATLFKGDAPTGEVRVLEIKDFTVVISITARGHTVTFCASSEGGCSGNTFGLTFK